MTHRTRLPERPASTGVTNAYHRTADRAAQILELLRENYGSHAPRRRLSPTDSLIATILSQHTADRNSNAAFLNLRRRYRSWHDIAHDSVEGLAETIRPAGLANIKALRIQASLGALYDRYETYDLSFLGTIPLAEGRKVLRALPGVGPKTAACVLLFGCGLPALPVDTHVHRVTKRLGLIDPKDSADRAHDVLEAIVPPADVYDFHVNLIAHGRQVCRARAPLCEMCFLQDHCSYYARTQDTVVPARRSTSGDPPDSIGKNFV
ncbi:MAG: endonuclease III [Chloroflexota bacterium]